MHERRMKAAYNRFASTKSADGFSRMGGLHGDQFTGNGISARFHYRSVVTGVSVLRALTRAIVIVKEARDRCPVLKNGFYNPI